MKQAAMLVVILALATFVSAQTQTHPAPAGAAATTPPPQGKRPPQAKTQAEFDAYKVVAASTDGATLEKAADDFATKFPDSELRILLYRNAMHLYQTSNDSDKMMETGRKVLKIDSDDPEALVAVAQVLAERTRESDLDKDQRLDEGTKLAQHALETADTDIAVPPGTLQHTIVTFEILHFGTSTHRGRFQTKEGSVTLDRTAKTGKADITVDVSTLSVPVASLEGVLKGERVFNVVQNPAARFVGDAFTFDGAKVASVAGTLTIMGKSQPVTLKAVRFNCYENGQFKREVCGGDFETTIQRSQFGLGFLPSVAPDDVKLQIQIEAIRQ